MKLKKTLKSIFLRNKNAYYCLFFLVIQQLIVASSTLWIIRLSRDIIEGTDFSNNLALYLASLILPYLPAAIMSILLVRWEQSALKDYIYEFISKNQQNVNLWSDKTKREKFISLVNHEGPQTINKAVNYYFGLTSAGLNTVLNVLIIAFLVDYLFVASYVFSIVLSFVLIKMQNGLHTTLVKKAQESRINLGKSFQSSWDNVVLGNTHNFKFWQLNLDSRVQEAIKDNVAASSFRELISIGISLVTFLPSLALAGYGMYRQGDNPVMLAAFLVILPRLFLILSYTYNLLYLVTQFDSIKAQIVTIFDFNSKIFDLNARINLDSIQINGGNLTQIPRAGRITIRGKNGSGKSSLLLELKRIHKENAFYLPSLNHLNFSFEEDARSTGELLKDQLKEIYRDVKAKIILLDEWDANLDSRNQKELSLLIDQIALEKSVVEVRHR